MFKKTAPAAQTAPMQAFLLSPFSTLNSPKLYNAISPASSQEMVKTPAVIFSLPMISYPRALRYTAKGARLQIKEFLIFRKGLFRTMTNVLFVCHGRIYRTWKNARKSSTSCVSTSVLPTIYQYFWRAGLVLYHTRMRRSKTWKNWKPVTKV